MASDCWPVRARHGAIVDRSGYRGDQLAAIELHDQAAAMGRLRRGAGRVRPGPDLAEQAVVTHHGRVCPGHDEENFMTSKPFDLTGKVAIVTGGNGGIGLGMARGLAEAGAAIAVAGRDEAKSNAAVAELKQLGAK